MLSVGIDTHQKMHQVEVQKQDEKDWIEIQAYGYILLYNHSYTACYSDTLLKLIVSNPVCSCYCIETL